MQIYKNLSFLIMLMIMSHTWHVSVAAEDEANSNALAQANNPLANMQAFNLHNYYIGELTGSTDSANQFWMRYARPFDLGGKWLMRA